MRYFLEPIDQGLTEDDVTGVARVKHSIADNGKVHG